MAAVNCGVIAAYLILTSSTTPYSGNQWLATEVIIVPLVEETFWRGIVFSLVLLLSRKYLPEKTSQIAHHLVDRDRVRDPARK